MAGQRTVKRLPCLYIKEKIAYKKVMRVKMEKNKFYQKENGKGISYILMILMSLLCVVIAGLLLFVPAIEVSTVCYSYIFTPATVIFMIRKS